MRLPGQYFDAETGLNYNYFRDYESGTGRYIEPDPIGLRGGTSMYSYVKDEPLFSIDPKGLVTWRGTYLATSVGHFVASGGHYTFSLWSECVNHKRGFAQVSATGWGAGIGPLPAGMSGNEVTFEDGLSDVNPDVFNGEFVAISAGATVGIGYGYNAIHLGGAVSTGSWGWQAGFDPWSASEIAGSAKVDLKNTWCCQ